MTKKAAARVVFAVIVVFEKKLRAFAIHSSKPTI